MPNIIPTLLVGGQRIPITPETLQEVIERKIHFVLPDWGTFTVLSANDSGDAIVFHNMETGSRVIFPFGDYVVSHEEGIRIENFIEDYRNYLGRWVRYGDQRGAIRVDRVSKQYGHLYFSGETFGDHLKTNNVPGSSGWAFGQNFSLIGGPFESATTTPPKKHKKPPYSPNVRDFVAMLGGSRQARERARAGAVVFDGQKLLFSPKLVFPEMGRSPFGRGEMEKIHFRGQWFEKWTIRKSRGFVEAEKQHARRVWEFTGKVPEPVRTETVYVWINKEGRKHAFRALDLVGCYRKAKQQLRAEREERKSMRPFLFSFVEAASYRFIPGGPRSIEDLAGRFSRQYDNIVFTRPIKPKTDKEHVGVEIECYYPHAKEKDLKELLRPFRGKVNLGSDGSLRPREGEKDAEIRICAEATEISDVVEAVCRALTSVGGRVDTRCGLHIHFDARRGVTEAMKIYGRLTEHQRILMAAQPPSRHNNEYCPLVDESFSKAVTSGRYRAVNASAFGKHKTIEARLFAGTTESEKIKKWISMCRAFIAGKKVKDLEEDDKLFLDRRIREFSKKTLEEVA